MSSEPVPGAMDSVRRGLLSLRANWELALLLTAQSILTFGLTLAGLLILLAGLGVSVVAWLRGLGPDWPQRLTDQLVAGLEAGPPDLLRLVVPLLLATLVWTAAFALYCYLQGGVMGILARAEIAAGGGLPGWRRFRSFSAAGFDRAGRRLFWRYFWLAHLAAGVLLVWLLLAVGLLALAVGLFSEPRASAVVAIGCLLLVPLLLSLLAIPLWTLVATVEVARPGAGVWQASRRALGALRQRLGGVLLIWLLALAGWVMVGSAFAPLEWGFALATRDHLWLGLGARGLLLLAEALANGALAVALLAALAALLGLGGGAPPAGEAPQPAGGEA